VSNVLTGGAGNDFISGRSGNDTLIGGAGSDTLTGGDDNDTFVFTATLGASNRDTVADFNVADDVMHLDTGIFGIAAGTLAAGTFVIGSAAGDADDRIIYNSATGAVLYDADGNGAGAAIQFATLTAGISLTNDDFFGI
jgi:serralysin